MKDISHNQSLVILSGGQNSRMGQNKAFLPVDRQSIIERVINQLGGLFGEILVVTNTPVAYEDLPGVRVVTDIFPNKGPLSGIHAGLTHAAYRRSLVVACDMPFVSPDLASLLLMQDGGWDAVVPVIEGKYQPLFALYTKECIPAILEQLQSGHYKITAFYEKVRLKELNLDSSNRQNLSPAVFYNVNTPAELEEARKIAQQEKNTKNNRRSTNVRAWQWKAGSSKLVEDPLIVEQPLTIYLNDQEIVTLLCSPENPDELAVGFLVCEGLLKGSPQDISLRIDAEKGMVWVSSPKTSFIAEQTFLKRYITTGCGKGTTFYNVLDAQCPPVESSIVIEAEKISRLMAEVQQVSQLFKETGGVHLTALCSEDKLIMYREDIGRHNALDKIAGRCFMDGIPVRDKMLFTTGRLSSEILLKVAKLGVPILVSRSAPTSLAVQLAGELGVTLIGFARAGRISIYTNEQRINRGDGQ